MPVRSSWGATARKRPVASGTGRVRRPDYQLLILIILLLGVGLLVVYAIGAGLGAQTGKPTNYYINKQVVAVLLGLGAFTIVSKVPLAAWRKLLKPLAMASIGVTLYVALFGKSVNGASRWLQMGGFSFQPVELIKFTVVLGLAMFLVDRLRQGMIHNFQVTLKPILFAMGAIAFLVLVLQSDFGSTMVLISIMGMMAFFAGVPVKRLALIGMALVILVVGAISLVPYRRDRFFTFLHPEKDALGTGYHINQALIAVGSGGMRGLGLGNSVQANGYLPEAANDSIFAVYAETFGFIGSVLFLALYGALLLRLLKLMDRVTDPFGLLVLVAVFTWMFIQAILNIGAMIGLLPLKGITLPLVSYGGTSLVFVMAALGIVFQISRGRELQSLDSSSTFWDIRRGNHENRPNGRWQRGTYPSAPGRRFGA